MSFFKLEFDGICEDLNSDPECQKWLREVEVKVNENFPEKMKPFQDIGIVIISPYEEFEYEKNTKERR